MAAAACWPGRGSRRRKGLGRRHGNRIGNKRSLGGGLFGGGQAGDPFGGLTEVGEFGGNVSENVRLTGDYLVQHPERILTHFFAGEKLAGLLGEVEAELDGTGGDGDADVVIGQEQAAVAAGERAARIEEPSF